MKKVIYPVLGTAIIIGLWGGYKIFKKGQYHAGAYLKDNQKRDVDDNYKLQKAEQRENITLSKTNEPHSSLSGSSAKNGQSATSDQQSTDTNVRSSSHTISTKYNPDLEDLFLKDFADTKRKANPSLIADYSVSLRPKENWLIGSEIEGESLVKEHFSEITSRLKNSDMTVLEMQSACVRSIVNSYDTILLETFYESSRIPSIDGGLFSKKTESLPDNTLLVSFTTKKNEYGIPQKTHKFYVSSLIYQADPNKVTSLFLTKAIEATKVAMAKEYLVINLSLEESKSLRETTSFRKTDLVRLLRSKYETTIYVPDYLAPAFVHKAQRLSKEGIFLRGR
ncbi:MAG: hypothetical protein GWN00_15900 [Aliifodinibius sp.]|nr:hypothetical protein [Fodinibius sp.]NIV12531.1 hypothetical protein [Fodinibius sp.]NIY26233.1 hypothetical protein [Fodinibius sp.]